MRRIAQARPLLAAGAALALAWPGSVQAQSTDGTEAIPSLQANGVRDPAMLAYAKAYELISTVVNHGSNRVQVAIRVVAKKTEAPIPDLDIALRGDKTFERLTVTPIGLVEVPLRDDALADHAELVSNQKKGTLHVEYHFVPKLPAGSFKYGDVVQSIDAARRVVARLTPWYLRPITASVDELGICHSDSNQMLAIANGRDEARPLRTPYTHPVTKATVHCAFLPANDTRLPEAALLTPPAGADLLYR